MRKHIHRPTEFSEQMGKNELGPLKKHAYFLFLTTSASRENWNYRKGRAVKKSKAISTRNTNVRNTR